VKRLVRINLGDPIPPGATFIGMDSVVDTEAAPVERIVQRGWISDVIATVRPTKTVYVYEVPEVVEE